MTENHSKSNLTESIKRLYGFYLKGKVRHGVFFLILNNIFFGLIPTIDSILLGKVIDLIETIPISDPEFFTDALFIWAVLYAVRWEGLNITYRVYDYIYLKVMPLIKANVVDTLYDEMQSHSSAFFQENMAGDVAARIGNAAKATEMSFYYFFEKIVKKLAMIMFALATLFSVHQLIGNIFLIWLILFLTVSLSFSKKIGNLSSNFNKNRANVSGRIVDSVANISVIRMFTSHKYERSYLNRHLDSLVASDRKMQWFLLKLRYVLGLSTTIMVFCMIYFIIQLRSQNLVSIGDCVLIISLVVSVIDNIWDTTQEFGDLFEEVGAFSVAIANSNNQIIEDHNLATEMDTDQGEIEFRNVTFKYKHNDNIFKDTCVHIPSAQKVGLVGFSGSGKTTFTKLIARLHDVESGEVLINGQNIAHVTHDSLRKHISIIPQEPILFHRSVIDNIRYGNESATKEEVIKAAKAAYIHDEIERLPNGYNTQCGERGNNFSIGQKQRIIIARAFLKDAPILILDEATSALDTHTELMIQKSLQNLIEGKTLLVIAHRLNTLLDMDRILVFDNGNIVEDGTHKDLKKNGKIYSQLWETQARGLI